MKRWFKNNKSNKLLYIVIFNVEFLTCFLLCFFIGLLINNEYMELDKSYYNLSVSVLFMQEECRGTAEELEPILNKSLNILDRKYDTVSYNGYIRGNDGVSVSIYSNFTYKNGKYYKGKKHTDYTDAQINSGTIIDEEAFSKGEHLAISDTDRVEGYCLGDTFDILGSEYRVAGVRGNTIFKNDEQVVLYIPVTAWDEIPVSNLTINLKCLMTKENKEQLEELFYESFGKDNIMIDDYAAENADLQAAYKSVFMISIMVMFASLGILSMLHTYLFIHRKKKIAIMRLCGCSRQKSIVDFVIENMIMAIVSTGVGGVLFIVVEQLFLADNYPYMADIYTPMLIIMVCMGIVALCVIQSLCMAMINVKKDVKRMLL